MVSWSKHLCCPLLLNVMQNDAKSGLATFGRIGSRVGTTFAKWLHSTKQPSWFLSFFQDWWGPYHLPDVAWLRHIFPKAFKKKLQVSLGKRACAKALLFGEPQSIKSSSSLFPPCSLRCLYQKDLLSSSIIRKKIAKMMEGFFFEKILDKERFYCSTVGKI